MTSRTRWLVLGCALVGLVFSGWAAFVHYRLLTQPNYISPCDINATFNCSELYLSRFGSVGGVSVAVGGLIFFAVVMLMAALSPPQTSGAPGAAGTYVFAMSTVGLAVVLYLGWASYFVLQKFCLLCIGTYAAVIALFIVSGTGSALPVSRLPGRVVSDLQELFRQPARLLATLMMVVASALTIAFFPREGGSAAPAAPAATAAAPGGDVQANFDALWAAQPRIDLGVPADGAKVVIVKFNDWQCPSCRAAYLAYQSTLDHYAQTMPGAVKEVVKDYPLNSRCNFAVPGQGHAGACEAAAAVRLATELGKRDEMVDWVFSNQGTLTPTSVDAEVKRRLGVATFAAEYARLLPAIKRDIADGAALKIQFTPTYYINGVKAQTPEGNFLAVQYFDYAIQYELKRVAGK